MTNEDLILAAIDRLGVDIKELKDDVRDFKAEMKRDMDKLVPKDLYLELVRRVTDLENAREASRNSVMEKLVWPVALFLIVAVLSFVFGIKDGMGK